MGKSMHKPIQSASPGPEQDTILHLCEDSKTAIIMHDEQLAWVASGEQDFVIQLIHHKRSWNELQES